MKPDITPERLYNNADMTQVRDLGFLGGCSRLIYLLEEAKIVETAKTMDECDYTLLKAQNDAQNYWRGIISMTTKQKEEQDE